MVFSRTIFLSISNLTTNLTSKSNEVFKNYILQMAVLNKIRQRSLFLIIIIALALFSFVLADLFKNSDAFTSKSQNIVATINGKDITREDFLQKVEAAQDKQVQMPPILK